MCVAICVGLCARLCVKYLYIYVCVCVCVFVSEYASVCVLEGVCWLLFLLLFWCCVCVCQTSVFIIVPIILSLNCAPLMFLLLVIYRCGGLLMYEE